MVISLEVMNFLERKNPLSRSKIRTNDVTSKHQLGHFRNSKKVKTDICVNVIYT